MKIKLQYNLASNVGLWGNPGTGGVDGDFSSKRHTDTDLCWVEERLGFFSDMLQEAFPSEPSEDFPNCYGPNPSIGFGHGNKASTGKHRRSGRASLALG